MDNMLILTCGLPRSGKSTWARKMGHPIVCPDAIRLSLHGQAFVATAEPIVWAIAKFMVSSLFEAGHRAVIVDACNISKKRRDKWLDKKWTVNVITFPTSKEECIERAKLTNRLDIIPVIERMAAEYESPKTGE